MIFDSSYWKEDLLKVAKKLELRLVQKRWRGRSFYALEKEIFLGFYSIRKLIESRKISDSIANHKYQITEFPRKNKNINLLVDDPAKEFEVEYEDGKQVNITVRQLCNQFIHSFFFTPFMPDGKSLVGLFVCSDYKRESGIYLITIFDIVDIYRKVGNNYPSTLSIKMTETGKVEAQIE